MKNTLLGLTFVPLAAGVACFGVLMHDVVSSGNAGRPNLHHSSRTISNLALGALLVPYLSVPLLGAAQHVQNCKERV